jgi:hypothetical protein
MMAFFIARCRSLLRASLGALPINRIISLTTPGRKHPPVSLLESEISAKLSSQFQETCPEFARTRHRFGIWCEPIASRASRWWERE